MAQILDFGLDDFFGLDTPGFKWLRPLARAAYGIVHSFVNYTHKSYAPIAVFH